ncbi:MAG TPA: pitrilysin family protein [Nitrospiraceae bacterium]|nr:pitrilysin family protein [Nitrospiraceae bacterium]
MMIRQANKAIVSSILPVVLTVMLSASSDQFAQAADINPVRFVMPNGLTVLVQEQHALPIVQIHALIKAGAAHDPSDKAGLANLVAGLLDEGTTTRSANQIGEQIEFVGGALQAKAGEDFTTASARVLKKDIELGFELLADILLHPAFAEHELERVRSQILGEIQSEKDDPGQVAGKAFKQVVFPSHPYRWPITGTEETLPKIKRADVVQFYTREYVPNQTILTIVGDITADQARTQLAKRFGAWKRGDSSARTLPPPHQLEKSVVKLIEKDLTQATILMGHVGISRTNPDYYAVTVMNYILGAGGFSSRLMDSIRDNQGLAYHVGSHFEANLMAGPFIISLQTRNEAANQAITGVVTELNRIREGPVSDQELSEAKSYLIGSFPLRVDTISKLADVLALVELYGLGLDYFSRYPKLIEQVTKEDVLRVAKQYLHPTRYALVVVANQNKAKVKS